jgi:hypothetical protein
MDLFVPAAFLKAAEQCDFGASRQRTATLL